MSESNSEVGRPTVMTPANIQKLEEAFLLGCSDLEACLYANISKTALYRYQEEHPEFTERKELLKETPVFKARKSVVDSVSSDPDLALKFLERKKKDEFSTKSESATMLNGTLSIKALLDEIDGTSAGLPSEDERSKIKG